MGVGVGVTLDLASIVQGLTSLALAGLVADHFRMRSEIAKLQATFVTWEHMQRFESKIEGYFSELRGELQRLGEGVAELRGRSGG